MKRSENIQALDACFATLERAAVAGTRCPERGTFGVTSDVTSALARAGRIKVEISGQNYRVVTILAGEHKGKATAPNPTGAKPWQIIDTAGARRVGGFPMQTASKSRQPSAPKLLTDWDYRV